MSDDLPDFKSNDQFNIPGLGTVHMVDATAPCEAGMRVRINGVECVVSEVGRMMHSTRLGLLVVSDDLSAATRSSL